MQLRGGGVSAAVTRRGHVCAFVSAALLVAAPAAFADAREAGRYSFEAFVPGAEDQRLPAELRNQASRLSTLPADILATDRAVEIEWVSREGPGLRGYRLTATIDGGPLSGMAASWTVAPGTGESGASAGPLLYRLRLPLPVDGRLRLHAALEAVLDDGSAVLLAVRHSTPARSTGDRLLSGPTWSGVLPDASAAPGLLPAGPAASLASCEVGIPDLRTERSVDERASSAAGDVPSPGSPRGPPAGC